MADSGNSIANNDEVPQVNESMPSNGGSVHVMPPTIVTTSTVSSSDSPPSSSLTITIPLTFSCPTSSLPPSLPPSQSEISPIPQSPHIVSAPLPSTTAVLTTTSLPTSSHVISITSSPTLPIPISKSSSTQHVQASPSLPVQTTSNVNLHSVSSAISPSPPNPHMLSATVPAPNVTPHQATPIIHSVPATTQPVSVSLASTPSSLIAAPTMASPTSINVPPLAPPIKVTKSSMPVHVSAPVALVKPVHASMGNTIHPSTAPKSVGLVDSNLQSSPLPPIQSAKIGAPTVVGGQVVSAVSTPISSVKVVKAGGTTGASSTVPIPASGKALSECNPSLKTVGGGIKKTVQKVSTSNVTLADILPRVVAMSSSLLSSTASAVSQSTKDQSLATVATSKTGQTGLLSASMLIPSVVKPGLTTSAASSKTGQTSLTTTPTSSGLQVPSNIPLSKTDLQLLAFLQSNLPHLSHVQESIKSIIQNNIILQSMKSSLLPSTSSSTSCSTSSSTSSALLLSPVKSSNVQVSSNVTPLTGITNIPVTTPTGSLATPTTSIQRKPVLAQVIGSLGTSSSKSSSSSIAPSHSSPVVTVTTKGQTPISASHIVKTTPPSSSRLLVNPMVPHTHSQCNNQNTSGMTLSLASPILKAPPTKSSPLTELSLQLSSSNKLIPLDPMDDDDDDDDMDQGDETLDVGQPVLPLELPSFLADHTYCIYNPTVPSLPRPPPDHVVTIPSERLSYAPEVPDSPRTLFKLLKVLPKKATSSSRPRSSMMKSHSSTPLGRTGLK